jgi:lysozyme family protein
MPTWNTEEKKRIAALLKTAKITKEVAWYKKVFAPKIIKNKRVYRMIADALDCPLVLPALLHSREMGSDVGKFLAYLGNGQPYNKKTTIVPKGRGPFPTFSAGAIDALSLKKIQEIKEWSIERLFYECERYNGFGYRAKGINTPYVYSYTNHYTQGHYVKDFTFSKTAKDGNIGVLALYKILCEMDKDFIVGKIDVSLK